MSLPARRLSVDWCVTRSTAWHVQKMAPLVREADRAELWSGWRSRPEDSLRHGLENSTHCWTALVNFTPVCMFGVVPQSLLSASGVIWLIATDGIAEHQVGFLRRCRPHLRRMQAVYGHLHNHVASENISAVNWLGWLGFHMHAAAPFGHDGKPFHFFEWVRDV